MKKYKLYLFDFDGTLLDTMSALEHVFKTSYGAIGIDFKHEETYEYSVIPLSVGFAKKGAKQEDWPLFCKKIEESLDSHKALISNRPYPESYEFLDYLKKNHVHCGIVTSNKVSHVLEVLDAMNIPDDIFTIYIGNRECEFFKPHPDPIYKALALVPDINKEDVVYIGDGLNDTISANAAGVDAILIDRSNAFPDSDKYIRITNLKQLFE